MNNQMTTPFSYIYDSFLSKITDDMYMELTELDTYRMLEELLMSAVHKFEFPRFDITDFEIAYVDEVETYEGEESNGAEVTAFIYGGGHFNVALTREEINILSTYMIVEWMSQQLASVENTRMKYSGTDFKMTSQANHLSKLLSLLNEARRDSFHMQRLYKRRKTGADGAYQSNWSSLMEVSALD